jgi:hypothetical protein
VQDLNVGDILAPGVPKHPPVPDTSVAGALDLPVAPAPVTYRSFADSKATRQAMQENILKAVQTRYPLENQRHRLALEKVNWAGQEHFTVAEQKKAILRGDSLDRRLAGEWVLYDKETGTEMGRRKTTVAHVPYLTDRGTFISNGNEYTVANQLRLKAGVYTRVKENGILEAHVNVKPGTGPSFRVYMEPDTGVFRLGLGQSTLKLYPILKSMGVDDMELEKSWGRELLQKNIESEDPRAVSRAFAKLVKVVPSEATEELQNEAEMEGGETKEAATAAGVETAAKWIAPVFGAAAVPLGMRASSYGYGLAGVARDVKPEIKKTKAMAKKFRQEFGRDAIQQYDKFDPQGETYKQWRMLRQAKFLEPYIRAGHEGLISKVTPKTDAIDVVRSLRRMTGTWKEYQARHYKAFENSPHDALKLLATEGMEDTKITGLNRALTDMMKEYDELSEKHNPYVAVRSMYNQPWAKVDLSKPESVKKFTDEFGNDALEEAKKKQALLFYASKSKLYAPKWYGALTSGSSVLGHALGLGGAAAAGIGGYQALAGLGKLLKRSEATTLPMPEVDVKLPEIVSTPDSAEVAAVKQEPGVVADMLAGANPFSSKVDVMGIPFKPETRAHELKRVIPAIAGKAMVGAVVVPSLVRSVIEAIRGVAKQGPYSKHGRLTGMLAGALLGSTLPIKSVTRAFSAGGSLRALQAGKTLLPAQLKILGKQLGDAPLRSADVTLEALKHLEAGRSIPAETAALIRKELFEPNATTILNAVVGGGITGYAGYASYKRGKRLREAFEQVYGKELPPEVAAVIMDPARMKQLSKARREAVRSAYANAKRKAMDNQRKARQGSSG